MKRRFLYIHGKGGSSAEAEHYKSIFPGDDVFGVDYTSQTPWEAREEFPRFFDENSGGYDSMIVVANSIGAYFVKEKNIFLNYFQIRKHLSALRAANLSIGKFFLLAF